MISDDLNHHRYCPSIKTGHVLQLVIALLYTWDFQDRPSTKVGVGRQYVYRI